MSKGFDIGGLLQQAADLKDRLANAQAQIESRTAEGRAGGGMVTCVVNGKLEVLSLQIDPSLLATPDRDMLQDLVTAAVNDGIRAAQRLMAEEMQKITGGIGLKLPGLG